MNNVVVFCYIKATTITMTKFWCCFLGGQWSLRCCLKQNAVVDVRLILRCCLLLDNTTQTNLNAAVVRWTLRWCLWRPTLPVRCILVAGRTSYSCFRIRCKFSLNMFCMLHLCSKKGNSEILYLGVPKQIGTTWQLSQICLLGNHSTLLYCTPTKTT